MISISLIVLVVCLGSVIAQESTPIDVDLTVDLSELEESPGNSTHSDHVDIDILGWVMGNGRSPAGEHKHANNLAARLKRHVGKHLQAVDITTTYLDIEPIAMSPFLDCTSNEVCQLELHMQHAEQVRHTGEFETGLSAHEILSLIPFDKIEQAVASSTTAQSRINLSPHSKGRVMFKPKLVKFTGSLVEKEPCADNRIMMLQWFLDMILSSNSPALCGKHRLGPFAIIAPVRTSRKEKSHTHLDGEWYLEYLHNPWPIDSHKFYNIRDKDIPNLVDATKVDKTVANAKMCGQFAIEYGFRLAIYRNATCYMKHTVDRVEMLDGSGHHVGPFGLEIPSKRYTFTKATMQSWIDERLCDMIDFDGQLYFCKRFSESPGAVMLFRTSQNFTSRQ